MHGGADCGASYQEYLSISPLHTSVTLPLTLLWNLTHGGETSHGSTALYDAAKPNE